MSFTVIPDPTASGVPGPTGPQGPTGATGATGAAAYTASAVKASPTSRSTNATRTADPDLTLPVQANTRYQVTAVLSWVPGGSGIQFSMNGPSGATMMHIVIAPSFGQAPNLNAQFNYSSGTYAIIQGVLVVGSTAGNISVNWAQQVSNATPATMNSGSALSIIEVA